MLIEDGRVEESEVGDVMSHASLERKALAYYMVFVVVSAMGRLLCVAGRCLC